MTYNLKRRKYELLLSFPEPNVQQHNSSLLNVEYSSATSAERFLLHVHYPLQAVRHVYVFVCERAQACAVRLGLGGLCRQACRTLD